MKRILGLTTAALLGASMFAAPALAVDLNADLSGKAGIESEGDTAIDAQADTEIDTGTTAAIDTTFDGALSAIDGNAAASQSLSAMTEISDIRVVKVSELEGHDAAAVERAVSENQADIDGLRGAIEANAALSQELEAQGVDASAIVAAQVEADGAVTLFVM